MSDEADLRDLDAKIQALTGEKFHQYTSVPGDGQTRVAFADGTVKRGYKAGLAHALWWYALVRDPKWCGNDQLHGPHAYPAYGVNIGCWGNQ